MQPLNVSKTNTAFILSRRLQKKQIQERTPLPLCVALQRSKHDVALYRTAASFKKWPLPCLRGLRAVTAPVMADPEAKKRRLEALMGGAGAAGGAAAGFGGGDRAGASSGVGAASGSAASPASPFEASANAALTFRLVRTAAELDTAPAFHPEFTHQVFREDETIFGYRDLKARRQHRRARGGGGAARDTRSASSCGRGARRSSSPAAAKTPRHALTLRAHWRPDLHHAARAHISRAGGDQPQRHCAVRAGCR